MFFYSLLIFLKDCCVYIVTAALMFFKNLALVKYQTCCNEKVRLMRNLIKQFYY